MVLWLFALACGLVLGFLCAVVGCVIVLVVLLRFCTSFACFDCWLFGGSIDGPIFATCVLFTGSDLLLGGFLVWTLISPVTV